MSYLVMFDDDAAVRRLTVDAERELAQRSVHPTKDICLGMNGIPRQLGFRVRREASTVIVSDEV